MRVKEAGLPRAFAFSGSHRPGICLCCFQLECSPRSSLPTCMWFTQSSINVLHEAVSTNASLSAFVQLTFSLMPCGSQMLPVSWVLKNFFMSFPNPGSCFCYHSSPSKSLATICWFTEGGIWRKEVMENKLWDKMQRVTVAGDLPGFYSQNIILNITIIFATT